MGARHAITLMGVLVAFVVIALLFATAHGYAALIASSGVLVGLLLLRRRGRSRARAFHAENKAGLAALARGDFAAARVAWEHWVAAPASPRIAALARHNLAWTMIREGGSAGAIEMLQHNEVRNRAALDALGLSATSAADRALAHGLRGTDKDAQEWLDRAEERMPRATIPTGGALALAAAVVHCRAGRIAEATKLLEDQWTELEATTTGDVLRPLRVVRAFVQATSPRSGGVAEAALPTLRPAYPSEFAFLGVAWPRMQEFLVSHDLIPRAA